MVTHRKPIDELAPSSRGYTQARNYALAIKAMIDAEGFTYADVHALLQTSDMAPVRRYVNYLWELRVIHLHGFTHGPSGRRMVRVFKWGDAPDFVLVKLTPNEYRKRKLQRIAAETAGLTPQQLPPALPPPPPPPPPKTQWVGGAHPLQVKENL
jgi:hypothetical protein